MSTINTHSPLFIEPADYIADLMQRGRVLIIPPNAGWTKTNVGSGDTSYAATRMRETSGGTANSSTLNTSQSFGLGAGLNRFLVNWTKAIRLYVPINYSVVTSDQNDGTLYVQLKEASTIGALGAKGLGIKVDTLALSGQSYNSALGDNALATLTPNLDYLVEIRHYPSVPKVEFWVDGVLLATETTSTKVPQTAGATLAYVVLSMANKANGYQVLADIGTIVIWQER